VIKLKKAAKLKGHFYYNRRRIKKKVEIHKKKKKNRKPMTRLENMLILRDLVLINYGLN
jgi:hypothetical protein